MMLSKDLNFCTNHFQFWKSPHLMQNLNYDEIEFIAQDEDIEIIPSFSMEEEFTLCQGSFGPFEVNIPALVPLWVGISLRRRGKCKKKIQIDLPGGPSGRGVYYFFLN